MCPARTLISLPVAVVILVALTSCLESREPLEPTAEKPASGLNEQTATSSTAQALGIDELYISSLSARSVEKLDDTEIIEFCLSALPQSSLEELITKRFTIISDDELIGFLSTILFAQPVDSEKGFLITLNINNATLGCIKACYYDRGEPPCSPCPECCNDDHGGKGPNYKFVMQ